METLGSIVKGSLEIDLRGVIQVGEGGIFNLIVPVKIPFQELNVPDRAFESVKPLSIMKTNKNILDCHRAGDEI